MDFGARIADAQGTKNASKAAFNNYQSQSDQAKSNYDAHLQNRRGYGDFYDQARDKYMNTDEINKARGVYHTARDAVNQINTTINKLPESIRQQYGGTGLTEAQRQRALQGQLGSMQNTQNYLNTNYQNASTDYNELVNRAMNEVNNVAAGNYKTQEDTTNILQGIWNTLLGQRNSAYGQYQQDENALANIYNARDNWELTQQKMALERWKEQQANARQAAANAANFGLQKYMLDRQDASARSAQAWNAKMAQAQREAQAEAQRRQRVAADHARINNHNYFGDWGANISQGWKNITDLGSGILGSIGRIFA